MYVRYDVESLENFREAMIFAEQSKVDPDLPGHSAKMINIMLRWCGWTHDDLQTHAENLISIGIIGD